MIDKIRRKLVLMLLLLVPLGYLAACGVHHTRPGGGFQFFFSREGKDYLTFQWYSYDSTRLGTLEIESVPTFLPSRSLFEKRIWTLLTANSQKSGSWRKDTRSFMENGIGWITTRTGDMSAAIQQFDLTNNEPVETFSIDFGNTISGDSMMFMIEGNLIRRPHEHLEMWDITSGAVLDSVATPSGPNSFFYKLPGTQNILVVDPSTSFAGLYASSNQTLRLIQDWKTLETSSFQRNDESFIANLLLDGATIEVRSARDGSVISSSPVPIDSMLPLPLTTYEWNVSFDCLRWSSLGIWTDVFTGQKLPLPDSFWLAVRNFKHRRLIAIRDETAYGVTVSKECVVVDETTGEQLRRFWIDLNDRVSNACILKKSGHLALATLNKRVHFYDLETGNIVRTIDPFKLGFPLNCAAAIMFGLWCIIWLRLASVHSHGWIDSSVCIGLFVAYASYRFYAALYSPADTLFIFASVGVLLASIQLTSIWLCLGKNRLVLRTAPFVLTIGLAAGLVNCWHANPNLASIMVAGIMPLTIGTMLALLIIRWIGVRFENVQSPSRDEKGSALHKESSINLRDLFLFTFVSAIVASVVRWIPVSYWYGSFFDQNRAWHFLTLVSIFAACLVAVVVISLWTIFSRRNIVVRWLPWIIALGLFQWLNLEPIAAFAIGAFATLNIGLHAYRQRGWGLNAAAPVSSPCKKSQLAAGR